MEGKGVEWGECEGGGCGMGGMWRGGNVEWGECGGGGCEVGGMWRGRVWSGGI